MIEVKGKVSGGAELARAFRELGAVPQKRLLSTATQATARQVARDFKAATPIGPRGKDRSPASEKYGAAIDKIKVRRPRGSVIGRRVNWGTAFYLRFREFGTSHQRPRPVFRPLWDSNVGKYVQHLTEQLAKGVQREAKKIAGAYGKARKALGARGRPLF
jgi:HK97 gp10 family phage protein